MFDIVGIDTPCIDLGVNVNRFPRPNEGEKITGCSWQGGGKVSSGMVAAARLGASGAMIASVGDDRYGEFCIADFKRHGIDTNYTLKRPGCRTNLSIVVSDKETKGRSILWRQGTAAPVTREELPLQILRDTRFLFISCVDEVNLYAADIARRAGASVLIDADQYSDELPGAVEKTDVFIGSEFVYTSMFQDRDYEKNCGTLLAQGPRIVVFTLGENGCVGISKETGFFSVPTFDVEVTDTVGAGDAFHGAFAAGLLQGWDARETARFSCAVSSIKCTRIGGRAGLPDMKTVLTFMKTGVIDYTEIDRRVEFYQGGIDHV